MTTTRKTPAWLAPGEGININALESKHPNGSTVAHQGEPSNGLRVTVDIKVSVIRLGSGIDISEKPIEHIRAVLNHLWCPNKPMNPPWLKFWKRLSSRKGCEFYEYFVEDGGDLMRLGKVSILTSQARFRSALIEATEHHSKIVLPHYAPDEWYAIVRCLLKVSELREEGSHV